MSANDLERRVVAMANLPTLPGILRKIVNMTEGHESGPAEVATLIATDQVLSAKVLRLVNSPIYGFPGRISSITHAVVLLGFNVVKGLVLGTAVFDTIGREGRALWSHSLGCAVVSRHLATVAKIPDPEEVMIAGLLHDLGKVALAYVAPGHYAQAVMESRKKGCHIGDVEREVFGVTHSRVGGWLCNEWHFPARLSEPLIHHHNPERAKAGAEVAAVIHVADILARCMGYGDPGDNSMPAMQQGVVESLGVTMEQLDTVLQDAELDFVAGASTLETDTA